MTESYNQPLGGNEMPRFAGPGPCEAPADCSSVDAASLGLLPDISAGSPVPVEPPPDLGGGAPGVDAGPPLEPVPDLGGDAPGVQ